MKVGIYARVSSQLQEKERTIESQLQELRKSCGEHQVVGEFIDDGWSGESLARPELDHLRDDAKNGKFEAVYVFSPDRFSRDLVNGILVKQELEREGIKVVFLNKDYGNDLDGDFYYKLDQLIAEKEKKTILDRFRRGKLGKARMGMVIGTAYPYGYKYVKKTPEQKGYYEINTEEALVVKKAFELYLEKQSILAVAQELNNKKIYAPRRSKIWRLSTLSNMLKDETYIGTTYFNKHKSVEPKKRLKNNGKYLKRLKTSSVLRDRSEWIAIKVPAIIDPETFSATQQLLKIKSKPYGVRKYDYLLSGLVMCDCGGSFSGNRNKGIAYYRCSNRRVFPLAIKPCGAKLIRADKIEKAIWSALYDVIVHPRTLMNFMGFISDKIGKTDNVENEINKLNAKIEKENEKRKRLVELYEDGGITKDYYKERIEVIDRIVKELEEEKNGKDRIINQSKNVPANKEFVLNFCEKIKKEIDKFGYEEKKRFLNAVIERISYSETERTARIIGNIPCYNENMEKNSSIFIQMTD